MSLMETNEMLKNAAKAMARIGVDVEEILIPKAKFYQTADALETIAIIEDSDGSISIGIARAGRTDIEKRLVTPEGGMKVAEGRARKARKEKTLLLEKNYLRGIHAKRAG